MKISEERKRELCDEYFTQIPDGPHNVTTKLEKMVDKIISRYFGDVADKDEYYGLADELFLDALEIYDGERDFGGILYTILANKIRSRMTRNNGVTRSSGEIQEKVDKNGNVVKRRVGIANLSLDAKYGDDDMTIADMVAAPGNISDEIVGDEYKKYLESLSDRQREIVLMLADGTPSRDIQEKLKISPKIYSTELEAARSYQNKRILIRGNHISSKKKGVLMSETAQTSKQVVMTVSSYIDSLHSGDWCLEFSGQRLPGQWSHPQKGALIETILQGYQIPALVVCEQKMDGGVAVNWVIDGMQRTSVLDDFLSDGFAVSRKIERPIISYQVRKRDEKGRLVLKNGIPVFENAEFDIRNKKFSAMPDELQKKIKDYALHFEMYLGCTAEDVEYHERRYNGGKPMNQNQKAQTYLGQEFAYLVNEVLRKPFFKNNYKMTEYVNAAVNRLVDEAVMAINFLDNWRSSGVDNCKFLRDNAAPEMFTEIGDLADRLDAVLSDETRKVVTKTSETFIFLTVFKKFTELGLDDSRFEDFMLAFTEKLRDMPVDGKTYYDVAEKATKDKRVVCGKIAHICRLMSDFFGNRIPEEVEVSDSDPEEDTEFDSYVTAYEALRVLPENSSRSEVERSAFRVALAVAGAEELSSDSLDRPLTSDDYEKALFYTEMCRDEVGSVDPKYLPAIVSSYKAVVDSDGDLDHWREAVRKAKLTGDYLTDFETLTTSEERLTA